MYTKTRSISGPNDLSDRQRRMYAFMHENPTGVISTTSQDGSPHGAVIYYTVGKDLSLHFLTKKRTRKYENLRHNNRLMLTVYDLRTQSTLQYTGEAVAFEGRDAVNDVAAALFNVPLRTSSSGLPPLAKLQAGAFTAFRVEPVQIRMAVYGRPETGDYNELFESIESFELADI